MSAPIYLFRKPSSRTYFFRCSIPLDLRNHFDGRQEFRVSLANKSKTRSQRAACCLHSIVQDIYAQIRSGETQMTVEEIKVVLRIELEKSFRYIKHIQLRTNLYNPQKVQEAISNLQQKKETRLHYYGEKPVEANQRIEERLNSYSQRFGLNMDTSSLEYLQLKHYLRELYLRRLDWAMEVLEGKELTYTELAQRFEKELKVDLQSKEKPASAGSRTVKFEEQTQNPTQQEQPIDLSLSKLFKEFVEEKRQSGMRLQSIQQHEAFFNELLECIGDLPLQEMSKSVVRKYLSIQQKLPPQRKKSPRYREKTVEQILKMKQVEPQSIANINKKLGKLGEFFRWIERRYDECPANPFEGMALSNRVTPKEREHFTDNDLQKILSKEYLPSTVHRMDKDTRFYIKHGVTYYWVFLIGIYSGMRTEEICKLRVDELKKEDGIWFFDIKGKVKTRNSVRRVPIHEKLIELGLLKYTELIKRSGEERLFWMLPEINDKYSRTVSKFFNDSYLKKVEVYEANKKILYSTRHTFITKAKTMGLDDACLKELVGHEQEFTQKHYAASMFDLKMLQAGINRVEYSKLNLEALRVDWNKKLVMERRK